MGRKKKVEHEICIADDHYKKSNNLANSKGRASLIAQKLFAIGIQRAVEDEKGILVSVIKGTELRKIFNKKSGSFYDQIKEASDENAVNGMTDYKVILTDDTNKSIEVINVITDAKFKGGILTIRFNDKLNKDIYQLKANYTTYSISEIVPLKHNYSLRLYEILKSEYDRQDYLAEKNNTKDGSHPTYSFKIDLTDLKLRLGIISTADKEINKELKKPNPDYNIINEVAKKNQDDFKKYEDFGAFRRSIIDTAQKELQKHTSISFDYDKITSGKGGKTVGIQFYIRKNSRIACATEFVDEPTKVLSDDDKLEIIFEIKTFMDSSFSIRDVRALAELANYDVARVRRAYDLMLKNVTKIETPIAWLKEAIKNNYQESKPINKFNNFPQNTYDFEELEQQLLEN